MTLWQADLEQQIQTQPDALAVQDSLGTRWTYGDLDAAIEAMRATLAAHGARRGHRVMLLAENCAAAVAVLFACARSGICVIPINARQTALEVQRVLAHAEPFLVMATSAISPEARAHADRMGGMEVSGPFGTLHLCETGPADTETPEDVAVLLYTTGTTGTPKGVMITHENLHFAGRAALAFRDLHPGHIVYGVGPISHVMGLASMLTATLSAGATVVLEARFDVGRLYQALRSGVSHLPAVPQLHALLMQYVRRQGLERLQSDTLVYVSSGGAPLDPDWKARAEAFYGLALQNGYGMTETTAATNITHSIKDDPDTSVGPLVPGVEMQIDESVHGGGDGVGEVLVRGPNIMKGYFRNPEETSSVLSPDGWLRTGDLGCIDEQERLHIMGRSKELIIHGGFNVYPPEVEAALNEHPQVVQSAVIGRLVAGDEKVIAFVQSDPSDRPELEELRSFAAERLTGYKRPTQIIVVDELPAAQSGKILKHKLLENFADQLA